jgi:hypothetical protein
LPGWLISAQWSTSANAFAFSILIQTIRWIQRKIF